MYRADASIAHIHNEHFSRIRNRYRREAIAHRRIFDDQRIGALEALMLFAANVGRDYLAAIPRKQLSKISSTFLYSAQDSTLAPGKGFALVATCRQSSNDVSTTRSRFIDKAQLTERIQE